MMKEGEKRGFLLLAIIVVSFVIYRAGTNPLSTLGYSSAYEGAKVRFIGVKSPSGTIYTSVNRGGASVARFDTQMGFDPDDNYKDMPNLEGEMTLVFIPIEQWIPPDMINDVDIPQSWWRESQYWQNPAKSYEWEVKDSDGGSTKYVMEEWLTMWFVSISADPDSGPDAFSDRDETNNWRYSDWEVWVEFDVSPTWYFEGTDLTHFAIASVEVSNVEKGGFDAYGNYVQPRSTMSVNPESTGSALYLYYTAFGQDPAKTSEELRTFEARDSELNPDYFRDKVYSYFTLANFGTEETGNIITGLKAKGDVITYAFTVRQFVVGEWYVQPNRAPPEGYGRESKVGNVAGLFPNIGKWLGTPLGAVTGLAFFAVILIAILSFTGVLPSILALLLMRKGGDE